MSMYERVCMYVCMYVCFRSTCVTTHHHEVREVQVLVGATIEAEAEETWVYLSICLHVQCL